MAEGESELSRPPPQLLIFLDLLREPAQACHRLQGRLAQGHDPAGPAAGDHYVNAAQRHRLVSALHDDMPETSERRAPRPGPRREAICRGTVTALRTDRRSATGADAQFDGGDLLLGLAGTCLDRLGTGATPA